MSRVPLQIVYLTTSGLHFGSSWAPFCSILGCLGGRWIWSPFSRRSWGWAWGPREAARILVSWSGEGKMEVSRPHNINSSGLEDWRPEDLRTQELRNCKDFKWLDELSTTLHSLMAPKGAGGFWFLFVFFCWGGCGGSGKNMKNLRLRSRKIRGYRGVE